MGILGPVGSTSLLVEMPHLSSSYRREPDGRLPVESASAPCLSLSLDPTWREMWLFFSLSTHMPPAQFFLFKVYMKWENKPLAPVQPHIHRPTLKIAFSNHWHLQTVWCLGQHVIPQCFIFPYMMVLPHLGLRPALWS